VCHTNFNGRHPDLLVFDLDPGAGVAWEFVIESALRLRKMQDEGLDSWPKTTGGKGLHLMVPIDRDISHDAARLYCKRLAQRLRLLGRVWDWALPRWAGNRSSFGVWPVVASRL
jgi:DNA primase